MFLRDVRVSLLRRWYLTIVGLLGSFGIAVGVYMVTPGSNQLTASVVLLPPATSIVPGGNPYLQLGGLDQAVDVLVRALRAESSMQAVREVAPNSEVTIDPDLATSGPILVITATDRSAASANKAIDLLLAQTPTTLKKLQTTLGIADKSQITSMVLVRDEKATSVSKGPVRAALVAGVAGLAVSLLGIAFLDRLLTRRRIRAGDAAREVALSRSGRTRAERRRSESKRRGRTPSRVPDRSDRGVAGPDHESDPDNLETVSSVPTADSIRANDSPKKRWPGSN